MDLDSRYLYGCSQGTVMLWDRETMACVHTWDGLPRGARISVDGDRIYCTTLYDAGAGCSRLPGIGDLYIAEEKTALKSYDYVNRDGFVPVTWERFGLLCQALSEEFELLGVEAVVGIARPGLFPAAQIALSLRTELFPVRVTRRVNDEVVHERPVWKVPVSPEVAGKVVAVVDEIADTGESLALVAQAVRQAGAARVITATLAAHTWASPAPDLCPLVTDSLVLWPWDQRVLIDGRWAAHPELVGAAGEQGKRLPDGWDDQP